MSDIEIVTDALRAEAKKWGRLADEMQDAAEAIARLRLTGSAFWCGDDLSVSVAPVYDAYQEFVRARCAEGAKEFEQIRGALNRAADSYDGSDNASAKTLSSIYGRM